jgi:hypothetical protein
MRILKIEPELQRLAGPIPDACHVSGLSRTEMYRRLAAGDIQAVKSGTRTLILWDSLKNYMMGLPAARFRGQKSTD